MSLLRLTLRRLRGILWTTIALACILAAVGVGLAKLLLPFAGHFQDEIEAWLSQRLNQPIEIAGVEAEWTVSGPRLRLRGVVLGARGPDSTRITVGQAVAEVDVYYWLRPGVRRSTDFRLVDLDLRLERSAAGRWSVAGLGRTGADGPTPYEGLAWLLRQGSIAIADSRVRVLDRRRSLRLELEDVELTLNNHGQRHRLAGEASTASSGDDRLSFHAVFQGDLTRGTLRGARAHLRGENVRLAPWLRGTRALGAKVSAGIADFELWSRWDGARLADIRGEVDLRHLRLSRVPPAAAAGTWSAARFELTHGASAFHWRRLSDGWRLIADRLSLIHGGRRWPRGGLTLEARERAGADGDERRVLRMGGDYLGLTTVSDLAAVVAPFARAAGIPLPQTDVTGALRDFQLAYRPDESPLRRLQARGRAERLGYRVAGQGAGVSGLSGRFELGAGHGRLRLDGDSFALRLPGVVRAPVFVESAEGELRWRRRDVGWWIGTDGLQIGTDYISARLAGGLRFDGDGTRPFADLQIELDSGNLRRAGRYWPVATMPPRLLDWLDRALLGGRLVSGRGIVHGDLDRYPFDAGGGRYRMEAQLTDVTLDYHPQWPRLEGVDAEIVTDGPSVRTTADKGALAGAELVDLEGYVPDFREPILSIDARGRGDAGRWLGLLSNSPLNDEFGRLMARVEAAGPIAASAHLHLPLKPELGEHRVEGTARLQGVTLRDEPWGFELTGVEGVLDYDRSGFSGQGLSAGYRGHEVELDVRAGGHSAEQQGLAMARMRGRLPASAVLRDVSVLEPIIAQCRGASPWTITATLPRRGDGPASLAGEGVDLRLQTSLSGTEIGLPAPLGKPAEQARALTLGFRAPYRGGPVRLGYGRRVQLVVAELGNDARTRGTLHFGSGEPELPEAPGIRVSGHAQRLDVHRWLSEQWPLLAGTVDDAGALTLRGIDISVAELSAFGRVFRNLAVTARPDGKHWQAKVSGDSIEGHVRVPSRGSASRTVVADLERLHWPRADGPSEELTTNPAELPPLRLYAGEFSWGNAALGEARLETNPTADGLRVDMLRTHSEEMEVRATGRWLRRPGGREQSAFEITMTAESLGRMLKRFGFAGMIEDGRTVAKIDARWSGTPASFALAKLGGKLEISVGPGRILDVEPGAGRILGLLSLQALPRRLSLDFSDLFGSGFSFDEIDGTFRLRSGVALTDDLEISAPAADVSISGSTDLAAQRYDQRVRISPSMGSTLPIVGALAGGPAAGAAVLLAQNVFRGGIAQAEYRIAGPWRDPEIERVREAKTAKTAKRDRD